MGKRVTAENKQLANNQLLLLAEFCAGIYDVPAYVCTHYLKTLEKNGFIQINYNVLAECPMFTEASDLDLI